jgi:carboxyl-terminal processing protease
MSLKTRGILVVTIGTVLGLSLSLGSALLNQQQRPLPEDLTWEQARLFAEVMERVKRDYVDPIDDRTLVESAIRGMVSDLDRHSQFLDADEYEEIRISTTGSYSGVGIEVSTVDDSIVVIAPIDNTPAQRAGIQSGDKIVAIDGTIVSMENQNQIIGKMRGRAGTQVIVSVAREEMESWLVFSLTRELIKVASVHQEVLEPEFGYLRISQFNETTADEVSTAIDKMMDEVKNETGQMLGGLVLDLRNNPGGILDAAVEVSDLFLDSGVIVTADGRTPESRFTRDANRGDILDGAVMVVLVNEGSASASEIVAGALQDHNRALVLGTSTFGKGLVQTVMPLSKGRAIKLTTSRYYTPSGDSIHEVGIEPDVFIEGSPEFPGLGMNAQLDREHDEQLTEAIETLRNQRVMHSDASLP